jgi:hypothetical protein
VARAEISIFGNGENGQADFLSVVYINKLKKRKRKIIITEYE